ncbi:MAG: imidazolonepropionase [Ignavibacteria bacterium]|jgi:imidazolonepropionase
MNLLIRNSSQIVTCKSNGLPKAGKAMSEIDALEDSNIIISDDMITFVGGNTELESYLQKNNIKEIAEFDASGKVIMPGFVDSHTHFVFAGSREDEYEMRLAGKSYQEIAETGGGIWSTVTNVRQSDKNELKSLAAKKLATFFSFGTTTLEGKSGYGLDIENELKMLDVINSLNSSNEFGIDIVPTFLGAHSIPREMSKESYVDLICNEMIPSVAKAHLSKYIDIFIEKGYFDVNDADRILGEGVKHGLTPRTHIDQFTSMGGTEISLKHGAVSLDHLEVMSDEDIKLMAKYNESAERKTVAGLLPGVSYFLGISYTPGRKLIDAGVPVLIATDFNPGSCMSQNMQLMMSLASTQIKMTAEEIINAVTINPAYSLGLDHKVGSIERGKQADLLIFDMPSYKYLIYNFGVNNLEFVVKKGKFFNVNEITSSLSN